jgi:hypothetical protein
MLAREEPARVCVCMCLQLTSCNCIFIWPASALRIQSCHAFLFATRCTTHVNVQIASGREVVVDDHENEGGQPRMLKWLNAALIQSGEHVSADDSPLNQVSNRAAAHGSRGYALSSTLEVSRECPLVCSLVRQNRSGLPTCRTNAALECCSKTLLTCGRL